MRERGRHTIPHEEGNYRGPGPREETLTPHSIHLFTPSLICLFICCFVCCLQGLPIDLDSASAIATQNSHTAIYLFSVLQEGDLLANEQKYDKYEKPKLINAHKL